MQKAVDRFVLVRRGRANSAASRCVQNAWVDWCFRAKVNCLRWRRPRHETDGALRLSRWGRLPEWVANWYLGAVLVSAGLLVMCVPAALPGVPELATTLLAGSAIIVLVHPVLFADAVARWLSGDGSVERIDAGAGWHVIFWLLVGIQAALVISARMRMIGDGRIAKAVVCLLLTGFLLDVGVWRTVAILVP